MKHPSTIKHPDTFIRTAPQQFDGVFDWSWTQGCFGTKPDGSPSRITPMDIDAVIERKSHFLIFETKGVGVPVPNGQMYMLQAMYRRGGATMLFIQGKLAPEKAMVWCESGFKNGRVMQDFADTDRLRMHEFVKSWYQFANKVTRI